MLVLLRKLIPSRSYLAYFPGRSGKGGLDRVGHNGVGLSQKSQEKLGKQLMAFGYRCCRLGALKLMRASY
jgi:hypothetical protein